MENRKGVPAVTTTQYYTVSEKKIKQEQRGRNKTILQHACSMQ